MAVTVQPVDEYQKQSSWGRRLLITGGVCFLLGGIFFYSQLSGLSEIVDPNKNNEVNLGIGEQESVNLAQSCYVAWSENMSDDIEFIVYDSHGEVVNQSGCGYELEAMDEIAPDAPVIEISDIARARSAAFLITAYEGGKLHRDALARDAMAFDPQTRDRLLAGALLRKMFHSTKTSQAKL